MSYSWETCTPEIEKFVLTLQAEINKICNQNIVGLYLHGSLAMGGFNPEQSDVDILVVTNEPVVGETRRRLAQLFLSLSNSPYPIEISFLNKGQLQNWQHPCPFDFHYSEFWRERYEKDLNNSSNVYLNNEIHVDPDLAAHITILKHRGICIQGKPIPEVFPSIPKIDYISSIMADFDECLENILDDPIYCSLNLLRVHWFLKEGVISSKLEAGEWGLETIPDEFEGTIQKVVDDYTGKTVASRYTVNELIDYKNYIADELER